MSTRGADFLHKWISNMSLTRSGLIQPL
ncbi:DUF768 domain-containing protein, partial [Mesorhizobium sp. M7A.F.Ca.CA.001.04.2.1]